jgi:hypothetical protein
MSRKVLGWGGLAVVGGGAYYLYNAGGDPKLAEKKMERMFIANRVWGVLLTMNR